MDCHALASHPRLAICEERPNRFEHRLHRLVGDVQPHGLPLASSRNQAGSRTADRLVVFAAAQHDRSLSRRPMGQSVSRIPGPIRRQALSSPRSVPIVPIAPSRLCEKNTPFTKPYATCKGLRSHDATGYSGWGTWLTCSCWRTAASPWTRYDGLTARQRCVPCLHHVCTLTDRSQGVSFVPGLSDSSSPRLSSRSRTSKHRHVRVGATEGGRFRAVGQIPSVRSTGLRGAAGLGVGDQGWAVEGRITTCLVGTRDGGCDSSHVCICVNQLEVRSCSRVVLKGDVGAAPDPLQFLSQIVSEQLISNYYLNAWHYAATKHLASAPLGITLP